jgi:hypothetical protein
VAAATRCPGGRDLDTEGGIGLPPDPVKESLLAVAVELEGRAPAPLIDRGLADVAVLFIEAGRSFPRELRLQVVGCLAFDDHLEVGDLVGFGQVDVDRRHRWEGRIAARARRADRGHARHDRERGACGRQPVPLRHAAKSSATLAKRLAEADRDLGCTIIPVTGDVTCEPCPPADLAPMEARRPPAGEKPNDGLRLARS